MRAVSIDKVEPGMQVGRTIYGASGEVLLAQGVKLTPRFINRLQELGINALYIQDEMIGEIEIEDVISEKTRLEALKFTKEVMNNIKLNPAINVSRVNDIVDNIITELLVNKDMVVSLIDIRAMNDYTFAHSLNVAILSVIIGITMGYDQTQLRALAAGALFHDIGKIALSEELILKSSPLTPEEDELLQKHTSIGFDILRKNERFSLASAHVALQHHEKYDGTGYPRHLKGSEIHEFARIVTVTDLYDKLTAGWEGQARCLPFQALELIMANRERFFDPEVVMHFLNTIALFPIGMIVLLNTKEKAVVVKTCKEFPTRPKVRILNNQDGTPVIPPYEVDLSRNHSYFIAGVLEEG